MELLLFLMIGFGVTTIITKSSIFAPLRHYLDTGHAKLSKNFFGFLIECPMCVGFWVGIFLSLTLYSPTMTTFFINFSNGYVQYFHAFATLVFDGSLLGGLVWSLHLHLYLIDKKQEFYDTKNLYYQYKFAKTESEINEQNTLESLNNK